jgi:2-polyprenyl-6-methoxyphenol hydroxylase-like FAD-dependent oxidoreductase
MNDKPRSAEETDSGTTQVPSSESRTIVIAGGGPVGMVLALELSLHGVKSTLVEQSPHTTTFPKMDLTNSRSMELLNRLGLAEEIRSVGVAPEHSFDVVFCSSLEGHEVGRWHYPSVDEMREWMDQTNDGTAPAQAWQRATQIEVERVLMGRCLEDDNIEVLRPWRVTGVVEDENGVEVSITSPVGGDDVTLRAEYLVGCDGAGSVVRRAMGLTMEGERGVVTFCQVHFKSRDRETLHKHGQFWHAFFVGGGVGAIIAQDEEDTWTLQTTAIMDGVRTDDIDKQQLLDKVCGRHLEIDEVMQSSVWQANVLVADHYRKGRLFVAGDAAHEFIPTGGYGLNTGFADAINLGWKLAAVVHGFGGEALLKSYEAERRPVAILGRDWSFRHLGIHINAQGLAKPELIDAVGAEGDAHRAELAEYFSANTGEHGSWGVEMGYRYDSSPVVVNDGQEGPEFDGANYVPTTTPGARAPHVTLADGSSPLDAFRDGYTLVTFAGESAPKGLVEAAKEADVPLRILSLDDETARTIYERDYVLVRPDGHVAWRGDAVPEDAKALLGQVTGHI